MKIEKETEKSMVKKVEFSEKQLQKMQKLINGQEHFSKKLAETFETTNLLVKKRV